MVDTGAEQLLGLFQGLTLARKLLRSLWESPAALCNCWHRSILETNSINLVFLIHHLFLARHGFLMMAAMPLVSLPLVIEPEVLLCLLILCQFASRRCHRGSAISS